MRVCPAITTCAAADKYPHMFKMLIVICTLGNPCVAFLEQDDHRYHTRAQCLEAAVTKHREVRLSIEKGGYTVQRSGYFCKADTEA